MTTMTPEALDALSRVQRLVEDQESVKLLESMGGYTAYADKLAIWGPSAEVALEKLVKRLQQRRLSGAA